MKMTSIVQSIEKAEQQITKYEDRLDIIERTLRLSALTDQKRKDLREEEKQMQEDLDIKKKELRSLRFENFKSMIISAALLGLIYVGYLIIVGS